MARKHFTFQDRTPPREFKLWNLGDNPTDYGVHRWTERSVEAIFPEYQTRGNPLVVDLEHDIGKGPEVPDPLAPTGGYATLDIRNGEPWLTFEWSALAEDQIRTGQRRFLSPEYYTDEQTGEIVGLVRVSLVASPGTHHARVLASKKEPTMIDPVIRAALKAALTAEDPKASIEALLDECDKAESPAEGDIAAAADPAEEKSDKPKPFAPTSGSGDSKDEGDVAASEEKKGNVEDVPGSPVAASEDKDEPVKASAARPAPPVMPRPAKAAPKPVQASAGPQVQDAITRVDDLERDMLLRQEGDRLVEPIRVWASSQPLAVVRGLVDAAPARLAPLAQARPVRGGQLGANGTPVKRHLTGEARRKFDEAFGRTVAPQIGPTRSPEGNLRIHAGCPGEYRRQLAAQKAGV